MKKIIYLLVFMLVACVIIAAPVFAAECGGVETAIIECDKNGSGAIGDIIQDVIDILSIAVGVLGIIGISIVGIQYLTAGGDEGKTRKAKTRMLEIIIGLAVYVTMWALAQWLVPGGMFNKDSIVDYEKPEPIDNSYVEENQRPKKDPSSESSGSSGGSSGGSNKTSNTSDRHKIGSALAVLHSNGGNDPDVKKAIDNKYFAVECDFYYTGGTIKCAHGVNFASGAKPFLEIAEMARKNGTKVIIDHLPSGDDSQLKALASIIKDNNLEKWVIGQTVKYHVMDVLNNAVGTKLEYMGLTMSADQVDTLANSASGYKQRGMTMVNIPRYVSGSNYTFGTKANIQKLITAGYDVCVFSWGTFSEHEISNYTSYGAKYLMTETLL